MRYGFIGEYRQEHRIVLLCKVMGVSRSGYYRWYRRQEDGQSRAESFLLEEIKRVYKQHKARYGSPRISRQLQAEGIPVSKNRVARLMRKHGIVAKTKKKFKITTNSKRTKTVSEDLLQQNFVAVEPNRVWTSDITYVWTKEGWLYLTIVLDVFSRMIVGWSVNVRLTSTGVLDAILRAVEHRTVSPGLIFHSDRGSQYASTEVRSVLQAHKMRQSMSGKGNCYDNAITETVFHTIKTEEIYFQHYDTRKEATQSIFEYIEIYYNRQRSHSALNYLSPTEFEKLYFFS